MNFSQRLFAYFGDMAQYREPFPLLLEVAYILLARVPLLLPLKLLELHSPLSNSSGSRNGAGEPSSSCGGQPMNWSMLGTKPNNEHQTHFLITSYQCHVLFTIRNVYRQFEHHTDLRTTIKKALCNYIYVFSIQAHLKMK